MEEEEIIEITEEDSDRSVKEELSKLKARHIFRGDILVWFMVAALIGFSLLVIYSSTISLVLKEHSGDTFYFIKRRFRDILISLTALFVVYRFRIDLIYRLIDVLFGFWILMLVLTLFFGDDVNGAARTLGPIQSSDFAKIAMIVLLAKLLTKYKDKVPYVTFIPFRTFRNRYKIKTGQVKEEDIEELERANQRELYVWRKYSWRFLLPIALTFLFIFPANLSTGILVIVIGLVVLLIGGIRFIDIASLSTVCGGGIYSLISFLAQFEVFNRVRVWKNRIDTFFSPEDSFQSLQAKVTIARGWIPRGPGSSIQRANLPRSESDFMFAFIIEEYSVLGAICIMLIFIWLFSRARRIARNLDDRFEALVCVGLSFFIVFQAAIHCLVNVGLMPVTGLVLPFLSAGGSALVSMSIAIGLVLNVSMRQRKV